ncbi:hypothetical protein K402DRAFT_406453 [Aulographum hederae CBS 113979]|uniref:Uncharacterized protein n=1 Tax=Aulographum hederae CBS 113979 TaxID=1176131 RepID=A0A6G1GSR4_9PEZI|nr:hypothetical protein K402DRAFT_406453 [Aulographum hederae CBS 113979]
MSGLRDLAKGGWHPKNKDGSKESWRGDFKGVNQISGWVGSKSGGLGIGKKGGKDGGHVDPETHQSAPLSTLRDPNSFGPPPKRSDTFGSVGSGSGTGMSPNTTGHAGAGFGGGGHTAQTQSPQSYTARGWGAAMPQETAMQYQERMRAEQQQEEEEANAPPKPQVPFRSDTTGLSTANLPKPPLRRDTAGTGSPVSSSSPVRAPAVGTAAPGLKPKPSLPPRLPPREGTIPLNPPPPYSASEQSSTPAGGANGGLNQAALGRLGQAGVSVPGFGIGDTKSAASPPPPPRPAQNNVAPGGQLTELQARFSRMNAGSSTSSAPPPVPEQESPGSTWAQKQAALKTAQAMRNDPSSVSLSDARSAASTANNFQERHGEQMASGWKAANGALGKVNTFGQGRNATPPPASPASPVTGLVGKKPPPPPPPKKKELGGEPSDPPPVPLASKPRPT